MCVVRMDNAWVGWDTAIKVQALLFEMQFMMWAGLLSEWHQAVQQLGKCARNCIGVPLPWGRRDCGRGGRPVVKLFDDNGKGLDEGGGVILRPKRPRRGPRA